jgi:hypothetical protein
MVLQRPQTLVPSVPVGVEEEEEAKDGVELRRVEMS